MTWDDGTPYVEELVPGLYAYVQPIGGWMVNNTGLITSGARSVLVDTTSTEKRNRAILAEVAKLSPGAPYALVNTHHHPDHTYGNGFLPPETVVIGHDQCRVEVLQAGLEATKVVTEPDYGNLTLRPPEVTFPDQMTLHLPDFPVELKHVGRPAHTTNDVLVWLPEQRVLFSGDLAFNGGQPFVLEGSIAGFRDAIAQMQALAPAVLVPGHGPVCRGEEVGRLLADMDGYLAFVEQVAAESHAGGLTPLEAARAHRDNPYRDWAEVERFVGNLHRAYAELDDSAEWARLGVPMVWPDMMTFVGGPIHSHA